MTRIGFLRTRARVGLAAAVQCFFCLVRRFLGLCTETTQQMSDAFGYSEDDSNRMSCDLLEGLHVVLESA